MVSVAPKAVDGAQRLLVARRCCFSRSSPLVCRRRALAVLDSAATEWRGCAGQAFGPRVQKHEKATQDILSLRTARRTGYAASMVPSSERKYDAFWTEHLFGEDDSSTSSAAPMNSYPLGRVHSESSTTSVEFAISYPLGLVHSESSTASVASTNSYASTLTHFEMNSHHSLAPPPPALPSVTPDQMAVANGAFAAGGVSELAGLDLPMPLQNLDGSQLSFEQLHKQLLRLKQNDSGTGALRAAQAHLVDWSPEEIHTTIRSFLVQDPDLAPVNTKVFSLLDLHFFMRHNILMEDLPVAVLSDVIQDPDMFSDDRMEQVRKEVYGEQARFPIPLPITRHEGATAATALPMSSRRRQFIIERVTQMAALQQYQLLQEQMATDGQGSSMTKQKRVWMAWVNMMADKITQLRAANQNKIFHHEAVVCELSLSSELLAVITCQTVLNLLYLPHWRRRAEDDKTLNPKFTTKGMETMDHQNQVKAAKYAQAVVSVGEAVSLENMWHMAEKGGDDMSKKIKKKGNRISIPMMASMMRRKSQGQTDEEALKTHTVPIGGTLIDILISCATIQGRGAGADPVPAFGHRLAREGKKTIGYIELQPAACQLMELGDDDTMAFLAPKHQPMVIPPRPWRPSAENPEGGYLLHKIPFIRTSNQKATHLKVYDTRRVANIMDILGNTCWRINKRTLALMEEVWERDMQVAGVPPVENPIVEMLPIEFESLAEEEQKAHKLKRFNDMRYLAELRSERPTFQLKLRVARDFAHAEGLHFPHNIDFRGRAYPIPPHLNHIGDDVCRGLLMFAEPKPLGEEGFYWLKLCLANLLGRDKLPFQERIDYIDESKEWIMKVADNPLHEDNLPLWVNAPDGPWQALARIFEITDAWRSPDPKAFLSCQPIHLDGSCNGLQHYAALGRDEEGGKAVNLTPSDRPQDVYSIVLKVVKEKVQKETESTGTSLEAEQRRSYARQLQNLDLLQRKVVKQTVMTICYGVTAIGAKEQVQGKLTERVGSHMDPREISKLAGYLSQLVLKSIDEVFERAMRIKKWFDKVSQIMNKMHVPIQWFSPIGLACTQPYRARVQVKVKTKRQSVSLQGREGPKVDKSKQRMGFPPNFVHSLDATHMMMVAEGCKKEDISFAGVHDSFWCHAADTPKLNRIIRQQFFELHSRPILAELEQDLRLHLGSAAHTLPELPEQSSLDLELVKDSPYMFD